MKKVIPFLLVISIIFISCSEDNVDCGTKVVNDQTVVLELGPQGGCFYENSNGNKTYVDRSDCKC